MTKQQSKKPVKKQIRKVLPQQVRIIGGQWKRTPLPIADAEGLRPTPDRVRETVFNWINHCFNSDWEGRACLDLFAGSGALGFEAASRGAARVVMVENHGPALRQLQVIKDKLQASQVTIVRGDAVVRTSEFTTLNDAFDLIFVDPPYHQDWLAKILPQCAKLLQPYGIVYVEAEMPLLNFAAEWLADWEIIRADKAGLVFYHLLQRRNVSEIQA